MKFYFLLISTLLLSGCINSPDIPTHKANSAKEKIQNNKYIALKARENYLQLQKQREDD